MLFLETQHPGDHSEKGLEIVWNDSTFPMYRLIIGLVKFIATISEFGGLKMLRRSPYMEEIRRRRIYFAPFVWAKFMDLSLFCEAVWNLNFASGHVVNVVVTITTRRSFSRNTCPLLRLLFFYIWGREFIWMAQLEDDALRSQSVVTLF